MFNILKRFKIKSLINMETKLTTLSPTKLTSNNNNNEEEDETVSTKRLKLTTEDEQKHQSQDTQQQSSEPPVSLIKKRKYALLIGYSGEGYFGLQRYYLLTTSNKTSK